MNKPGHLLVGVDFSTVCVTAVKTALRLAHESGATVTAVHVVHPWLADELKHAFNHGDEQVARDVERKVRQFIEPLNEFLVPVEVVVRVGHPVVVMQEMCLEVGADLLVLGTRGSDHGPNEVGAVAAKCIRKVKADVLLVRQAHQGPFRRVTACVDFSETSARALRMADKLARLEGAGLTALHVCQSPGMLSLNYAGFLPDVPREERQVLREAEGRLEQFVREMLEPHAEGVRPAPVVVEHVSIREAIAAYLGGREVDLLVLGLQGRSHIKEFFIGTAAETMIQQASCSVLVVKPTAG